MENRTKKLVKVGAAVTSLALVGAISFGATVAYLTANTTDKKNTFSSSADIKTTIDEPHWDIQWGQDGTATYKPGDTIAKDPEIKVDSSSKSAYLAASVEFKLQIPGKKAINAADAVEGIDYIKLTKAEFDTIAKIYGATEGDFGTYDDTAQDGVWSGDATINVDTAEKLFFYYVVGGSEADQNNLKVMAPNAVTDSLFENVKFTSDDAAFTLALQKIYAENGVTGFNYETVDDTAKGTGEVKPNDCYPQVVISVNSYAVQADGLTDQVAIKAELKTLAGIS